nr:electron transfer flavoprotein subunit beta/FixA family protein [Sedimentibacter sp.]
MNIIVCMKPVPDPDKYNLLTIDSKTKRLVREGIPTIVNPSDKNALEEALKIKEMTGCNIIVLSMAPMFSQDKVKECLAMGADEAYLVSDRAFGGADTFSTSYTLAKAIEKIGVDVQLILLGNESADGATSQVPSQLGEWLDIPHITNIIEMKMEGKTIKAKKKIENGYIEYEVASPALLSIARGSNKPRLISAMGIIKAKNKRLEVLTRADLDVDDKLIGLTGSPTQAGELIVPNMSRASKTINGSAEDIAGEILSIVKKAGISI